MHRRRGLSSAELGRHGCSDGEVRHRECSSVELARRGRSNGELGAQRVSVRATMASSSTVVATVSSGVVGPQL